MNRRYYALQDFFLAQFHPDWRFDFATRRDAVAYFVRTASPDEVDLVRADLQELLSENVSDQDLHDTVLRDYSLFHDPEKEGITMRDWLTGLLREIDELRPGQC